MIKMRLENTALKSDQERLALANGGHPLGQELFSKTILKFQKRETISY